MRYAFLLLLTATACASPQHPTSTPDLSTLTSSASPQQADLERQMIALINADRATQNLPPLTHDPRLTDIALAHSRDMREHRFFDHISPHTGTLDDRLHNAGYLHREARENIALHESILGAQQALLNSPGHRANIFASGVTHVGVGAIQDGDTLLVTQLFAHPAQLPHPDDTRQHILHTLDLAATPALDALAHDLLTDIADGASLAQATQNVIQRIDPHDFSGITAHFQPLLELSDLELPNTPADAIGVATLRGYDEGEPRTLVLILFATTR